MLGTVDVVPGKLAVSVFAHDIAAVRCWTYASAGLWALGQRELLVSVKQEPGEADPAFPRDLLHFFWNVFAFASQKRLVDEGGVTMLSAEGPPFLPASSLRGVLYAAPQTLEGVPVAGPFLTAILVTLEEAQAATEYGHSRILGRLGESARYFPTPPWADRRRASVVAPDEKEKSVLGQAIPRMALKDARVWQESRVEVERTAFACPGPSSDFRVAMDVARVVLQFGPGVPERIAPLLSRLSPTAPFIILTALDADAGAAFVWHPGARSPSAITGGRETSTIGGSFVLFLRSPEEQGAKLFEDGFVVSLHEPTFEALKHALAAGNPLEIEPAGDLKRLSMVFLPAAYRDPISGRALVASGGWKTGRTGKAAPPRPGPVQLDGLVLLTPESEIARRLDAEALSGFIRAIDAAVVEAISSTQAAPGTDLLIDAEIGPARQKTFRIAARRPGIGPLVRTLYELLDRIQAPSFPDGSVHFQVKFALWGGAGIASPRDA